MGRAANLAHVGTSASLTETATIFACDPDWVAAFDREGRLLTYARGERFFKRSLASRLFERRRSESGRWRELDESESQALFEEARARAVGAARANAAAQARFEREIAPWSAERLLGERQRFAAAYRPIAILPPDRYLSVVVQATEGCSWNRCTFCSFYQDRPFRVRAGDELRAHLAAVADLLGRDLARRRSLFLADGNALALGQRRLTELFTAVRRAFPGLPIASFVDVWSGEKHDPADWRELAAQGLEQVYVGMESGADELLRQVDKPGTSADCAAFVADLKRAGIAVSPIVIVGLGGAGARERQREATLAALADLGLDPRDLVYLSPCVEEPQSTYTRERRARGERPLSRAELDDETARWAEWLRARGLRVGRYEISEFFY